MLGKDTRKVYVFVVAHIPDTILEEADLAGEALTQQLVVSNVEGTKSKTEGKRTKTERNTAHDGCLRCSLSLPTTLNVSDARYLPSIGRRR
jgi:hypothetical protein